MSLAEEQSKFPGQPVSGIPPSPTRENPAQVFPKTDPAFGGSMSAGNPPQASHHGLEKYAGNPYMIEKALQKVNDSIRDVIEILVQEEKAQGDSRAENALLAKFQVWKDEVEQIMAGNDVNKTAYEVGKTEVEREGGMFTD